MYYYNWNQWLTFFFIYCFLGWVWESCFVSVKSRRWVNRGFLRMPMLPIYGFGAIIMLLITLPFPGNYPVQFCLGVIGPTILEYITGWGMEKIFKMRYWDYSNQKFNINGYICLSSSIAWGFFTIIMTHFLHPPIENLVINYINPIADYILVVGISILFIIDTVQSARAALDVGKALEKMTEIRAQLDDIQVQISLLKAETAQRMEEKREAAIDRMYAATDKVHEATDRVHAATDKVHEATNNVKEDIAYRMTALAERLNELNATKATISEGMSKFHRGLLRGNPTAASKKFGTALKELKEIFR
ncbi:MAG: hypothetical protein PUB44_02370 [Clostridium sp.]|nr:hypothetical protein [Clostridium sp.]